MTKPQRAERGVLAHPVFLRVMSCTTDPASGKRVRVLIVAYGNPLRSDDGLAWHVADALEGKFPPPEVEILRLHQLAPELAERVSRADAVIFVDAASADAGKRQPGDIRIEEIHVEQPDSSVQSRFSHHLTPAVVVAMAAQLYGASARAFSATLTGVNFEHGESLSGPVHDSLPEFVTRIEGLALQLQSPPDAFPARSTKP